MSRKYYIYILTNKSNTLYIGVTNDLQKRLWEHKQKLVRGFSARYNVNKLIYFEEYRDTNEAIKREKQIKGWVTNLIKTLNPKFEDLGTKFNF